MTTTTDPTATMTDQTLRQRGVVYRVTLSPDAPTVTGYTDFPLDVLATPDGLDSDWIALDLDGQYGWRLRPGSITEGRLTPDLLSKYEGRSAAYLRPSLVRTFTPLDEPAWHAMTPAEAYAAGRESRNPDVIQARTAAHARGRAEGRQERENELRDALIAEGERRDWCGELDTFLRDNGMAPRQKEYDVTLTISFTTTVRIEDADDEDDAIEKAKEDVESSTSIDPFASLSPVSTYTELTIDDAEADEID